MFLFLKEKIQLGIIKMIISVAIFSLTYCIWSKIVDRVNRILKRKLTEKQYDYISITACIVIILLFIKAAVF